MPPRRHRKISTAAHRRRHQPALARRRGELRETGQDGANRCSPSPRPARPAASRRTSSSRRRPGLDIRITDVINNDIEILSDPDKVLVYDRPTHEGVLWRDLQAWWRETPQLADDGKAKAALYKRLRSCLPANSPLQRNLFDIYHHIQGNDLPGLPALLPEVWLHWDPKAARERGPEAMLSFRMDFLLLLPHGHRVVLEVDGATHYSTDGRPDPAVYAKGACADREVKLARYEVFRFGATELKDLRSADPMLRQFFTSLFRQFRRDASRGLTRDRAAFAPASRGERQRRNFCLAGEDLVKTQAADRARSDHPAEIPRVCRSMLRVSGNAGFLAIRQGVGTCLTDWWWTSARTARPRCCPARTAGCWKKCRGRLSTGRSTTTPLKTCAGIWRITCRRRPHDLMDRISKHNQPDPQDEPLPQAA